MTETAVAERPTLTHFQPDKAYSPERPGAQIIEVVVNPLTGKIEKAGNPRDVRLWVDAERNRIGVSTPKIDVVRGGVMLPGFVDAHTHPFVISGFELPATIDISTQQTKEGVLQELKTAANNVEPGKFIVAMNLDTTHIKDLTNRDLDEISRHKVVVFDPSLHGCVVNSSTLAEVARYGEEYQRKTNTKLSGQITPNGHLKEQWVYMAIELYEAEGSAERLAEISREQLESHLRKGITTIQDLELSTYTQVVAWLMLRRDLGDKIPISQVYLQPRTLAYVRSQIDELKDRGLVTSEEDILALLKDRTMGIKLYADGAFGSHTALVDQAYADLSHKDTHRHGMGVHTVKQLNDAVRLARDLGIENVAIHAIGDKGIGRALNTARRWRKEAGRAKIDPTHFRIEHFEMPTPEILDQVAELGIWVTPQPNFLTDYVYSDRLKERIRMLCPHKDIINKGIPMMFGSDTMPTSALFGIWMATHAPEESQRLTLDEALLAYTVASGIYEGKERGTLQESQQADVIVMDQKGINRLLTGDPLETQDIDTTEKTQALVDTTVAALDSNVQRVYRLGQLVHSKAA